MIIRIEDEVFKNVGIAKFYEQVAAREHLKGAENSDAQFDCTKINVAENIQTAIFEYYASAGYNTAEQGMLWVISGPKVDETLDANCVDIQEGFIVIE